tara:strand:+ start:5885 stop:6532 length:648 start_codon:yes stop_codon:yes gene_type:complete
MKILKNIAKWMLCILSIPVFYILISLLLTTVTVNSKDPTGTTNKAVFLSTNGVHLEIVMPVKNIDSSVLKDLKHYKGDAYLSFGWGEENFYLNTPTWGDLTAKNAVTALFLQSATLVHVTRYQTKQQDWVEVQVTEEELNKLNSYLKEAFRLDETGAKIHLENAGYTSSDDFYKSNGNYSCFKTCNSWVNTAFKTSGLKACYWTPFDFGLLDKYE